MLKEHPMRPMYINGKFTNDCQYGLYAVLISDDTKKIKHFSDDVKAGTSWINDPYGHE